MRAVFSTTREIANDCCSVRNLALLLTAAIAVLLLQSCRIAHGETYESAVATEPQREIMCLGRVVPGDGIVKIATSANSVIREMRVKRGDVVEKGQILAVLENYRPAFVALKEADLEVAVAQSEIEQAEAPEKPGSIAAQEAAVTRQAIVLRTAESEFKRRKSLYDEQLIAAVDFETAELNLATAREGLRRENDLLTALKQVRDVDVAVARNKLAVRIAARDQAAALLEQQVIRAPLSGTVLQVYTKPGELPGAEGILDLGQTTRMFVEGEVYAGDIRRVREGARAAISGEAFEGTLTGKVDEVLREAGYNSLFTGDASNAADKRVIKVRIRLDDSSRVEKLSNSQVSVRIAI